jgi:lincosamide nucleotidyltransferase A/C/D/E
MQAPRHFSLAKLRNATRRYIWAVYRWVADSRLAPLLELAPVQRLRRRLRRPMQPADVFEILAALDGIRAWVAGGWAVDALLAEQTRQHNDLDLVLDFSELEDARAVLAQLGFRRVRAMEEFFPGALMPRRILLRDPAGRIVELHGVDLRTWPGAWLESLRREGRPAVAVDAADAFAEGSIAGRSVPCLSAQLQVASRQSYEPTEVDRQDIARLCATFDLPLPAALEADRLVLSESTP